MSEPQDDPKPVKLKPRGKQWRKGQSGNPWGRKPGTKTHSTIISEATASGLKHMVDDGKLTLAEAIAHRRLEIALSAKPGIALNAINSIEERLEGKPQQNLKVIQTMDEDTARRLADIGEMLASKGIFPAIETTRKGSKVGLAPSLTVEAKLLTESGEKQ